MSEAWRCAPVFVYGRVTMTPERGGHVFRWYAEDGSLLREVFQPPVVIVTWVDA